MADPEQIYSEVLQEEQGKGVTAAVAEARAKAARARAEHGSPHPKEPKWWPGAQPHLEGGDGAAPAEEPAAEEAAPEPAAEPEPAPAAEAPAPAADPAPAAAEAPAPAAAAAAPAAPAAAAVAATPTALPPEQRPGGVTHGVPTGTRLRPEDEVQTDAQFAADQLMLERRRRIDEVVAASTSGAPVPAGPRSGQWLLFLVYLAIAGSAIFIVIQNPPASGESAAGGDHGGAGGEEAGITVVAENVAFTTSTIELPANEEAEIQFDNNDAASVPHNIAIYEDDSASKALFQGDTIPGGESTTYTVPPQKPGSYYFQCDVHPGMNGDVQVQ